MLLSSCICSSTAVLVTPENDNESFSPPISPKNDGPKMMARFSTFMRLCSVFAITSWKKPHKYCNNALSKRVSVSQ